MSELVKKAEGAADKHYDRRNPAWSTARDHYILGAREALKMAAEKVRYDCPACEGSGHADAETECEYCGRPMVSILSILPEE